MLFQPWIHCKPAPECLRKLREFDLRNENWIKRRDLKIKRLYYNNNDKLVGANTSFRAQPIHFGGTLLRKVQNLCMSGTCRFHRISCIYLVQF